MVAVRSCATCNKHNRRDLGHRNQNYREGFALEVDSNICFKCKHDGRWWLMVYEIQFLTIGTLMIQSARTTSDKKPT